MQLPDYHEVIERPMDFSTVRKQLSDGAYANLEAFEVGSHACDYISKKFDISSILFSSLLFLFVVGLFFGYSVFTKPFSNLMLDMLLADERLML